MTVKHGSFDGVVRPLIEMDDILVHAVVPLLDARVVLYQHFLELDRRVKRAASRDEVCMRMMTVPGVGPIASLTFKAAIELLFTARDIAPDDPTVLGCVRVLEDVLVDKPNLKTVMIDARRPAADAIRSRLKGT
jgi:hypothetical protein